MATPDNCHSALPFRAERGPTLPASCFLSTWPKDPKAQALWPYLPRTWDVPGASELGKHGPAPSASSCATGRLVCTAQKQDFLGQGQCQLEQASVPRAVRTGCPLSGDSHTHLFPPQINPLSSSHIRLFWIWTVRLLPLGLQQTKFDVTCLLQRPVSHAGGFFSSCKNSFPK